MPLPQRIGWCRSHEGPKGWLSHDKFAAELGTTRHTTINWEKGQQPSYRYAAKLAEFSGFPPAAFRRPEAEKLAQRQGRLSRSRSVWKDWRMPLESWLRLSGESKLPKRPRLTRCER